MTADKPGAAQKVEAERPLHGLRIDGEATDDFVSSASPARLTLLYESRDGKFCLFQDGDGHLAAIDASKLA